MEANALPAAALALLLLGAAPGVLGAPNPSSHPPPCESIDEEASRAGFHAARIRSTGYVEGSLDVQPVDEPLQGALGTVYAGEPPPFRDESFKAGIARDVHVVAEPLHLVYGGVPNHLFGGDLPGDTPTTEVEARAGGVGANTKAATGTQTFTGATKLDLVFSGRIIVHTEETIKCGSFKQSGTKTITARQVELMGYATQRNEDDSFQDPWGTGLDVQIEPGKTERR